MKATGYLDLYNEIYQSTVGRPVINTHAHQLPAAEFAGYDLENLLRNSYLNWCGVVWGETDQSRAHFIERLHFHAYFVWLQKSLQEIYGFDEPLRASNWEVVSQSIRKANQKPGFQLGELIQRCGYRKIVEDAYWRPGSDNGHPEFFSPVFRINAFHFGYDLEASDHDGNNPYRLYPRPFITNLDEYLEWVRQKIVEKKDAGCVALKLPIAYDRGLDFAETPRETARQAFQRLMAACEADRRNREGPPKTVSQKSIPSNAPVQPEERDHPTLGLPAQEIKAYQDFIFFQICRFAAELDIPVQIHTGMGQGRRTNALWLQDVIQKNPDTRFALLHGSYPWIEDIPALVRMYPNVFADLCWLPLGSTQAGKFLLHELIENAASDKIMWGCDTWTAEESYGALLAFRHVLSSVLAEKVFDGYFPMGEANQIVDNLLYKNAVDFFHLEILAEDQKVVVRT